MKAAAWILFKKHGALPVLALALILLIAIGASTYADKDNATFQLKDLAGSRDAIADVVISGELRDGYHSTHFRVEDGKLRTETEIFRQPKYTFNYHYSLGGDKLIDDTMFSVHGFGTFDILAMKPKLYKVFYVPDGSAKVTPTIQYGRDDNGNIDFANPLEYGIAKIGDKVYFTVPVSARSTGSSGIYDLNFYNWGDDMIENVSKKYPPRLLAELDLKENESAEPPNIEVLGLEAVGDKLALIFAENGELILRSYDSGSGAVLGEATLPNFRLQSPATDSDLPSDTVAYAPAYEAFSDSKSGILNLSFRGSSAHQLILSADLTSGVRIVNQVAVDRSDEESRYLSDEQSAIRYLNGRLYVVRDYKEARNSDPSSVNEVARPHHFYLYVYERSKLIYQGELLTDLNDDNGAVTSGTDAYDDMKMRYFTNLAID